MTKEELRNALNEQFNIIHDREGKLKSTDYIAAKIAEGKATKTEYRDQINERQGWRDDINAAQAEVERLLSLEVEEPEPAPLPEEPTEEAEA